MNTGWPGETFGPNVGATVFARPISVNVHVSPSLACCHRDLSRGQSPGVNSIIRCTGHDTSHFPWMDHRSIGKKRGLDEEFVWLLTRVTFSRQGTLNSCERRSPDTLEARSASSGAHDIPPSPTSCADDQHRKGAVSRFTSCALPISALCRRKHKREGVSGTPVGTGKRAGLDARRAGLSLLDPARLQRDPVDGVRAGTSVYRLICRPCQSSDDRELRGGLLCAQLTILRPSHGHRVGDLADECPVGT